MPLRQALSGECLHIWLLPCHGRPNESPSMCLTSCDSLLADTHLGSKFREFHCRASCWGRNGLQAVDHSNISSNCC